MGPSTYRVSNLDKFYRVSNFFLSGPRVNRMRCSEKLTNFWGKNRRKARNVSTLSRSFLQINYLRFLFIPDRSSIVGLEQIATICYAVTQNMGTREAWLIVVYQIHTHTIFIISGSVRPRGEVREARDMGISGVPGARGSVKPRARESRGRGGREARESVKPGGRGRGEGGGGGEGRKTWPSFINGRSAQIIIHK